MKRRVTARAERRENIQNSFATIPRGINGKYKKEIELEQVHPRAFKKPRWKSSGVSTSQFYLASGTWACR